MKSWKVDVLAMFIHYEGKLSSRWLELWNIPFEVCPSLRGARTWKSIRARCNERRGRKLLASRSKHKMEPIFISRQPFSSSVIPFFAAMFAGSFFPPFFGPLPLAGCEFNFLQRMIDWLIYLQSPLSIYLSIYLSVPLSYSLSLIYVSFEESKADWKLCD